MGETSKLAQRIYEQAQALPEDSLIELARYVEFLRFKAQKALSLQEQLAKDYDELAAHYDELAAELADDIWLPLENEALAGIEKELDS
jgi:hypothetical protein